MNYDTQERSILVDGLETAVSIFLKKDTRVFQGWVVLKTEVDSTKVYMRLGSPTGIPVSITSAHFAEVAKYLPMFTLSLPIHNLLDNSTQSARLAQECFLEYDIHSGNSAYKKQKAVKKTLIVLLILFLISTVIVCTLFLKHTEHDSSRFGTIWKLLFQGS